ncbi:MAG: mechanosensitive ion channel [Bacteroidales bacterium]|jgi:miniconductance mechanosensitive channel|nr:mechanosensitive ion channel family protein [Bacteroidales bacterium]NCU34567.1 mechanosensitive ion channel [Candidatus Falkowbacteria bacterium]MDD2631593.1 mechanosensitive ion channel [Bacteroidales bacterium]MDD3526013.1 mechanosensitive ion channel [Bacteroidales bacterium]MDD4176528.1 mechanosensitive ion channel [Bacteroidales bacterium]
MFETIDRLLQELFDLTGISPAYADVFIPGVMLIIIFFWSYLLFLITRQILKTVVARIVRRTRSHWDDALLKYNVFSRVAYLVPAYVAYKLIPYALDDYPDLMSFLLVALQIYSLIIILLVANAIFDAILGIYNQYSVSKYKPIKGYLQVGKIIVYIFIFIWILSVLIGQNPLILIGGLGAFSAVLMLVFQDTLLGLVGGVQLSANDMLRPGDWITMQKYDADGTVTDITLTTVKVQNWDKTISTLPAYSLFTESFKNWRGMEESGGRRIKRSISIDMNTVRFCTREMLEKYKKIRYINEYVESKEVEIEQYNLERGFDTRVMVNGRRQTNIGVFRAYLSAYLMNHPDVHKDMTFLIRHLQPTEKGLPIEIYIFSKVQAWADYEGIQADIFDHILAIIPEFDLRIFQYPTNTFTPAIDN